MLKASKSRVCFPSQVSTIPASILLLQSPTEMGRSPFSGVLQATLLLVLLTCFAASSTFISDGVFSSNAFTGRSLLQQDKDCPVDFGSMNYTIITDECKGPRYPKDICCTAFKQFACPFAVELNDVTNNCAVIMFSYIHIYGNYPPGLFANMCSEGRDGLSCPASSQIDAAGSWARKPSPVAAFVTGSTLAFILF